MPRNHPFRSALRHLVGLVLILGFVTLAALPSKAPAKPNGVPLAPKPKAEEVLRVVCEPMEDGGQKCFVYSDLEKLPFDTNKLGELYGGPECKLRWITGMCSDKYRGKSNCHGNFECPPEHPDLTKYKCDPKGCTRIDHDMPPAQTVPARSTTPNSDW